MEESKGTGKAREYERFEEDQIEIDEIERREMKV